MASTAIVVIMGIQKFQEIDGNHCGEREVLGMEYVKRVRYDSKGYNQMWRKRPYPAGSYLFLQYQLQ